MSRSDLEVDVFIGNIVKLNDGDETLAHEVQGRLEGRNLSCLRGGIRSHCTTDQENG